jgi:hypothetical protein
MIFSKRCAKRLVAARLLSGPLFIPSTHRDEKLKISFTWMIEIT